MLYLKDAHKQLEDMQALINCGNEENKKKFPPIKLCPKALHKIVQAIKKLLQRARRQPWE